jgi:hypothetical protein
VELMGRGYYRMARGWMDHPELTGKEPFSRREAWCWLIEHAAFADRPYRIGSIVVNLTRGQIAASTRYMGKAWEWDEKKVRRFLVRLKTASMIAAETAAGVTVITLCNYNIYQSEAPLAAAHDAAETAAEAPQQRRESNKGNKGNKESNAHPNIKGSQTLFGDEEQSLSGDDPFELWWREVPRKVGKGQARRAFIAALRKASFDSLIDGIRRYGASVADTDAKFICHPATWLNGERWLDDLPAAAAGPSATDEDEFDREWTAAKAGGDSAIAAFLAKHGQPTPRETGERTR